MQYNDGIALLSMASVARVHVGCAVDRSPGVLCHVTDGIGSGVTSTRCRHPAGVTVARCRASAGVAMWMWFGTFHALDGVDGVNTWENTMQYKDVAR